MLERGIDKHCIVKYRYAKHRNKYISTSFIYQYKPLSVMTKTSWKDLVNFYFVGSACIGKNDLNFSLAFACCICTLFIVTF